ncbi:sensor histidine kinase [Bacillus rubiinfantis]|uniref:sensor histidine kinase n=1 Tax=Bacillus rubiinfantis TaxID=1499680 RepID=UPI001FE99A90|nr:ATP-binding protein [Bacillus rubiinfantis]
MTRIYSGVLMLFLALFIIIVNIVLHVTIIKSQERELNTLVSQEAAFLEKYLHDNNKSDFQGMINQEVVFAGVNQAFYYVVDTNGKILIGNEEDPRLRSAIASQLNKQSQDEIGIHVEKLQLLEEHNGRGNSKVFHHPSKSSELHVMIASHYINYQGKTIGKLYIGKDISLSYQLFKWVLIILIILGFVFFGFAILMSQKMSKKAMVPINKAFVRQQEFTADASHELRTPLSVLLSSIDAIEMTITPQKEDFSGRLLANMRQEVKRMARLVNDLLTLARSDSNTLELRQEKVDVSALTETILESLQPLAAKKQLNIESTVPPSLAVIGDSQRLSQLLYILLDNAIKYTPVGGSVKLTLSSRGSNLYMAVQDTGIGIRKEDYTRIFERFYRADKARTRTINGHGLGLAIAKWIVNAHQGTIQIESELGKGSTFEVIMPKKLTDGLVGKSEQYR